MARKKITELPVAAGISKQDKLLLNQSNTAKQVSVEKLLELVNEGAVREIDDSFGLSINDGAFVMYHNTANDYPYTCSYQEWAVKEAAGQVADGVLVVQGGKMLVVAPTDTNLKWSSKAGFVHSENITDRVIAMNDWDGKVKTAAIVNSAIFGGDGAGFAPGFCAAYSRVNENGSGLTSGKWWLPSCGELMFVMANRHKINKCLAVITGASLIDTGYHWGSTEGSSTIAWRVSMSTGYVSYYTKATNSLRVRAVSAFIM